MAEIGRTYTPQGGANAGRLQTLTDQVTSQIRGAPQVRQQMGEELMAQEQVVPTLASERGKLVENLFNIDQQMADKYSNPEGADYIEDPMARERMASGQASGMWGALAGTNEMLSARKKVLGDTLDKGMAVYEMGIRAKQAELDNQFKMLGLIQQMETAKAKDKAVAIIDPKMHGGLMTMEVMFQQLADKSAGKALGKWKGGIADKALSLLGPESNSFLRELKEYKDIRYGLASQIARSIAGESGVLNEADIQRALGLLPDIFDVPQSRANKLASLRQFMDSKWEGALKPEYQGEAVAGMPTHLTDKFAYIYGAGGNDMNGGMAGFSNQGMQNMNDQWELAY